MIQYRSARQFGILGIFIILQYAYLIGQNNSKEGQFFNYTVSDGLPSMEVYDILQDQQGYIWLGTEAGLCRYDGYQFFTYTTKDGLPNNDVIDIEEDQKGRIWINSLGPLAYLEKDSFVKYDSGLRLTYSGFNLVTDKRGEIWINYAGKVLVIDHTNQLNTLSEPVTVFGPQFTVHRVFKQDNWVWIATSGGLFKFEGRRLVEKIPIKYPSKRLDGFRVNEYNGFIYYTSDEGLIQVDYKSELKEQKVVLPEIREANQMIKIDNEFWLVSVVKGVYQLESKAEGELSIRQHFLENAFPSKLIKDEEGNLWVASYGNGVYFYPINANKFKVVDFGGKPALRLESVAILEDRKVVGDLNGRVQVLMGKEYLNIVFKTFSSRPVNRILEIKPLFTNTLLVGTDQGLFRCIPGQELRLHSYPVKNFYIHSDGRVLVNTFKGTFISSVQVLKDLPYTYNFEDQQEEVFTKIFEERSYASLIDSENRIWLGNSWTGLTTIQDDSIRYWKDVAPIFNAVVIDLVELDSGIICAATQGDGLILINGNDYFLINESDGLSSSICNDIISDGKELWIATNKGISYIRGINFEKKSFTLSVFNEADGLLTSQVEALDYKNGILYMATSEGLMECRVTDLVKNQIQPRIHITSLFVNDKSVALKDTYHLPSNQNNIRIQYVGLSYKSHGNLLYKYQLEGIDKDWIRTASLETHYSHLPAGAYRFKITAIGNAGQESLNMAEVRFIIHPHFSETFGFRLFVILILLVLLYILYSFIYNYQQRSKLERLVAEKTKALNQKYKDLESVNAKLELSNRELEQFAHVASHDLKAPLRNVAGFVQLLGHRAKSKLNKEEKEFIQFAVDGVKKMNLIIEDLLAMSKIDQLEQKKVSVSFKEVIDEVIEDLQFQIAEKKATVYISGKFPTLFFNRTNTKQLWQNLISNALTYQDKDPPIVEVSCSYQNRHWLFCVKDNGIGIAPEFSKKVFEIFQRLHGQNEYVGTGVGLAICKKIIEKNNGEIWFQSEKGKGTSFYFTLPGSITVRNSGINTK